jgi:hypothetical protein
MATLNLNFTYPEVRNIGSIHAGFYNDDVIFYDSIEKITKIVMEFIERNGYLDEKFNLKYKVIELNPSQYWDISHHIKVKNRVPYTVEVSAMNAKSWYVTIYSKKPIKTNGYSHEYLQKFIVELKKYLIQNQCKRNIVKEMGDHYPGEIETRVILFVCAIWIALICIIVTN